MRSCRTWRTEREGQENARVVKRSPPAGQLQAYTTSRDGQLQRPRKARPRKRATMMRRGRATAAAQLLEANAAPVAKPRGWWGGWWYASERGAAGAAAAVGGGSGRLRGAVGAPGLAATPSMLLDSDSE